MKTDTVPALAGNTAEAIEVLRHDLCPSIVRRPAFVGLVLSPGSGPDAVPAESATWPKKCEPNLVRNRNISAKSRPNR